jgi:trk system potassium uptake protein TrkH
MNFRITLHVLGGLLLFLGATLLVPIPLSLFYGDGEWLAFVLSAAVTLGVGGFLFRYFRRRDEVTLREAFAIVTFAWILFAVFGALPYVFAGSLPNPVDAFFESMSGFTTAGASVMTDIESNAKSVLFWRALTQWLGGMGFIVLGVAILPLLGVGGMQLYQAEAAGPSADRLTPRIQDTARYLWGVYVLITACGIILLWIGEMDLFDATCHTFTAVATGGFSTRNASLGAYGTYAQLVTMLIMLLGSLSFSLHYFALRGKLRKWWASDELRWYLVFLCSVIVLVVAVNWPHYGSQLLNLRDSSFTVMSIVTTTGFATADYEHWPMLAQGLLFASMFLGGCAGSTSGGLKQVRFVLLVKHAGLQVVRLVHPRQVVVLKLDRTPVSRDIMEGVLGFAVAFLGVFVVGALLLNLTGVDLVSAGSSVIACLSTVGPGLGELGPTDNYAGLTNFAKLVLCGVMLLGRLEVFTVLVLISAPFWRR